MSKIESIFETCYSIENSENNQKIVICCKNNEQVGKTLLTEYFLKNNEVFKEKADIEILRREYEKFIPKLIYRREKRLIQG